MLWQFLLGALAFLKSSPTIIQETEQWGPTTPEEQDLATQALHGSEYGGDMILPGDFPLGMIGIKDNEMELEKKWNVTLCSYVVIGRLDGYYHSPQFNGIKNEAFRWPGFPGKAKIPYVIDPSLSHIEGLILRAMEQYNKTTCVKFVPRKGEEDFIRLYNGPGCFSNVGKWGGMQNLSLNDRCHYIGSIVHELGHAIGLYHEHQRSDRDTYIDIYGDNIVAGQKVNFQKTKITAELLYDKFNYDSIMIYGNYAFSKNNKTLMTMQAKGGKPSLTEPWAKPGLTNSDIYRVNCLYECEKKKCPIYRP